MYLTQEQRQLNSIRHTIIDARKAKGLSQEQVAKELGICRATYNKIESHTDKMDLGLFIAILHELGLDMSVIERQSM